jgi:hypothetical protein
MEICLDRSVCGSWDGLRWGLDNGFAGGEEPRAREREREDCAEEASFKIELLGGWEFMKSRGEIRVLVAKVF